MKKGISPLIAVVLLIVIGVSLVAIVIPMIRQPTEETMKEASETTERIFECKNIDYDIMNPCKCGYNLGQPAVWLEIENKKNNEIYNFIFQLRMKDTNEVKVSRPWSCMKKDILCSDIDTICGAQGGIESGCPLLVKLGEYEKALIRTEKYSSLGDIESLELIPEIAIENKRFICKDIIKKINIQSLTACTRSC